VDRLRRLGYPVDARPGVAGGYRLGAHGALPPAPPLRAIGWLAGGPVRVGETVRLAGWVHRRRLLKSVAFLILRDAAGLAQVVVSEEGVRA
jgi:OB-fold nucleic acid binding domain